MRCAPMTLVLASVLALGASCGGEEPPPEGFHLMLHLTAIDPSVLDDLRVNFEPQGTGERFMDVEPMSYEDGAINVTVEPDGVLVITLAGAHVAAQATDDNGDGSYLYDLEIWTADERVRMPAPTVRVIGNRGGEQIAEGFLRLVAWPPPLRQRSTIEVACRMAVSDRCFP